jgi:KaiC/GvpD/RAD55 family RecA-like ATPase
VKDLNKIRDAIDGAIRDVTYAAIRVVIDAATWDAIWAATYVAIRDVTTRITTWDAIYTATYEPTTMAIDAIEKTVQDVMRGEM